MLCDVRRPRSRFPMQGMVGPDWRAGACTFSTILGGIIGWACLIILAAPDDGRDALRTIIVVVGLVLAVVTLALYLCTACTDPGIVFKHLAQPAPVVAPPPVERGTQDASGGNGGSAPTGAGTPVRFAYSQGWGSAAVMPGVVKAIPPEGGVHDAAADPRVKSSLGAHSIEAEAGEKWGSDEGGSDAEQEQRLQSPTGALGVAPEYALAAANVGSAAVIDMRHAPPPTVFDMRHTPAHAMPPWGGASTIPAYGAPHMPPPPQQLEEQRQESLPPHEDIGGVISVGEGPAAHDPGGVNVCGRCEIIRPQGAVHCHVCGVCVHKLDHHCPFMGQCVGRKNLWCFYAFIVAVWLLVLYAALAVVYLVVAVVANGLTR